jgi:hypothetical protein
MFIVTGTSLLLQEVFGSPDATSASAAALGTAAIHLPIIALQRFNRSRMIQRVNAELANGETYDPSYRNSFGIDSRAVDNYYMQHGDEI